MAETLADAGARVALVARSTDKLQRVADDIKKQGGTAEVVTCDVGDSAQVTNMVATVLQKFGRADTLVTPYGPTSALHTPHRSTHPSQAVIASQFMCALCKHHILPCCRTQRSRGGAGPARTEPKRSPKHCCPRPPVKSFS